VDVEEGFAPWETTDGSLPPVQIPLRALSLSTLRLSSSVAILHSQHYSS